jgi:hypothetical protein
MTEHTDDLRNVREGDGVVLTTSNGSQIRTKCFDVSVEHADERTGEVRETTMWRFQPEIVVSITDGLRSSPDDPEFPIHNEAYAPRAEESIGFIESVKILGQMQNP